MAGRPDDLAATLVAVSRATVPARDPWWIIGSAAVRLHDVDPGPIGDVDLLMSARDAAALLRARGIAPLPGVPDDRFRSSVFGRWTVPAMTVEVMGGLATREAEGWRAVRPVTRQAVDWEGVTTFVPDRAELVALLRRFGRPKDLARAALLD